MGRFFASEPLGNFNFSEIKKNRTVKLKRAVRFDDKILIEMENGDFSLLRVYGQTVNKNYSLIPNVCNFGEIDAFVKFGLMKQTEASEVKKRIKAYRDKEQKKYDVDILISSAEKLGIKLTPDQMKLLK